MKPREIFGIVVRGVGLFSCVYAVRYAAALAAWPDALILGGCLLIAGIWLVRGAPGFEGGPGLVDFAYPEDRPPSTQSRQEPESPMDPR